MSVLPRCICDPFDALTGKYDQRCDRHRGAGNYDARTTFQHNRPPEPPETPEPVGRIHSYATSTRGGRPKVEWFRRPGDPGTSLFTADHLRAYAEEAVRMEREACAKICDEQQLEGECPERASYCADAIRARTAVPAKE